MNQHYTDRMHTTSRHFSCLVRKSSAGQTCITMELLFSVARCKSANFEREKNELYASVKIPAFFYKHLWNTYNMVGCVWFGQIICKNEILRGKSCPLKIPEFFHFSTISKIQTENLIFSLQTNQSQRESAFLVTLAFGQTVLPFSCGKLCKVPERS